MAKDWRKFTAAAELSRRLDKLETALGRAQHDQELQKLRRPRVTHLSSGQPIGILIDDEPEPVHKLVAKEWVKKTVEDNPEEFNPSVIGIKEAGEKIARKSETAPDCAKPFKATYGANLLRELNIWRKKPRNPPKHRSR